MFEPGLEARDVLFDLFDERQMSGQLRQALIHLSDRLISLRRASRDESRVKSVVFGATQTHSRKGTNLDRLQEQYRKSFLPQISHDAAFITSGRFDTNAYN